MIGASVDWMEMNAAMFLSKAWQFLRNDHYLESQKNNESGAFAHMKFIKLCLGLEPQWGNNTNR